jgi:UPF0755 protein
MGKDMSKDLTAELGEREVTVEIEPESSLAEVSKVLEDNGIVKSALFFRLEHILKGNDIAFEGGTVTLNSAMSSNELMYALKEKPVYSDDIAITIREGFSVKDIGTYLESLDIVTADEFIETANTYDFSGEFAFLNDVPLRENRLEGYLFPDTYYIAKGWTSADIIRRMLTRFEEIYGKHAQQAEESGLSMDEVITIASIIEKEIKVEEERPKAAQVIFNRLNSDTKLEMCSTILYVLGKNKDRLYDSDLQVDSPYNTYLNLGLPIGPISNPGEACISAVLNPSKGTLMYFVVKDEETGEHIFTDDYNEFLNAKEIYNQKY